MRFIREALDKGTITLFGNGEEFRDHVHADDVAAIIDKAVSLRVSGEFNVSSGQSVSFANMASMIAKRSEIPIEVKSVARQGQITHRFIENTVLLSAFPNQRPRLIETGLDDLFEALNYEF